MTYNSYIQFKKSQFHMLEVYLFTPYPNFQNKIVPGSESWRDDPGPSTSKEILSVQLMLYLLGAHIKRMKVLRYTDTLPTPVLGLYIHNMKVRNAGATNAMIMRNPNAAARRRNPCNNQTTATCIVGHFYSVENGDAQKILTTPCVLPLMHACMLS